MKRLLVVFVVGLLLLGMTGVASAGATSTREPITLRLNNSCTGERVRMTAIEHVVVREGDQGSIFHLQWTNAKAIGIESGSRYIITGGPVHSVENINGDGQVLVLL